MGIPATGLAPLWKPGRPRTSLFHPQTCWGSWWGFLLPKPGRKGISIYCTKAWTVCLCHDFMNTLIKTLKLDSSMMWNVPCTATDCATIEFPFSFYFYKDGFWDKNGVFTKGKKRSLLVFSEKACPLVEPFSCIYAANGVLMGFHVHFPDRWAVLFRKMNNWKHGKELPRNKSVKLRI